MVEPRIVVPDVAGSNPVGHPAFLKADFGLVSLRHPYSDVEDRAITKVTILAVPMPPFSPTGCDGADIWSSIQQGSYRTPSG
jgi:hypothetical protein